MKGCILSFILLTIGLLYDKAISTFFYSHQNAFIVEIMRVISDLGTGIAVFFIASIALINLSKSKKKDTFVFWISLAASLAVTYLLKNVFLRERPYPVYDSAYNQFHSFPSGHSTGVFSAYAFLSKFRIFGIFWLVFSFLVAFSRIYLGYHYLSDVVVGGLLGYAISLGIQKIAERIAIKREISNVYLNKKEKIRIKRKR
jgi:undecaprenyl-diphosphatase